MADVEILKNQLSVADNNDKWTPTGCETQFQKKKPIVQHA